MLHAQHVEFNEQPTKKGANFAHVCVFLYTNFNVNISNEN